MKKKWFFENLREEALKHKTKGEFKKGSVKAWRIAITRDDYDAIVEHMPKHVDQSGKNSPVLKWPLEKIKIEALKYKSKKEFRKQNFKAWKAAYRSDNYEDICSHMARLWEPKWNTVEKIKLEADKYTTKTAFAFGSAGAYRAALRLEILDEICSHMPPSKTEKYGHEELQKEADKYSERTLFAKGSPNQYQAVWNRGKKYLDLVCIKMVIPHGPSSAEKELFKTIKTKWPNTTKIMDMKVSIPNKPYIQGFEIDIFVPELMKGVEFDGKYHHSFKYMRKDKRKKNWSDEDILNYHQLKDSWFLSKGIQILHIREEDWIEDKEACIQKCFDFLQLPNFTTEK